MKELGNHLPPCPSLPKLEVLARAVNGMRQSKRPDDPVDLNFDLDEAHFPPGFLKADVRVRERRHLLFASDEQLTYIAQAKQWFIDGTFKLCRRPFTQLLTINAFVRKEECVKKVPLLTFLMSGRKRREY